MEWAIVDLCAGVGGGTLGAKRALEAAGRKVGHMVLIDHDENCTKVQKTNFPTASCITADASDASWDTGERPTVLIAGPPCQGHSNLNNYTRFDDPRNKIYGACVMRAVEESPEVVLIENVPSIVRSKGSPVGTAESCLEDEGYHVQRVLMEGERHGLAQRRRRLFLVATKFRANLDFPDTPPPSVLEVLSRAPKGEKGTMSRRVRVAKRNQRVLDWLHAEEGRLRCTEISMLPECKKRNPQYLNYGRIDPEGLAHTITGNFQTLGAGMFGHPTEARMLTLREGALLQGFPPTFDFAGHNMGVTRKMIGNAIPPAFTERIMSAILRAR